MKYLYVKVQIIDMCRGRNFHAMQKSPSSLLYSILKVKSVTVSCIMALMCCARGMKLYPGLRESLKLLKSCSMLKAKSHRSHAAPLTHSGSNLGADV